MCCDASVQKQFESLKQELSAEMCHYAQQNEAFL